MTQHHSAIAAFSLAAVLCIQVHAAAQSRPASTGTAVGAPASTAASPASAGTSSAAGVATAPPAKPAAGSPEAKAPAPAVKPAPRPAEKAGLARLAPDWPKWLTVTFVDRMRVESVRPPATREAEYDSYLLNRFRLTVGARFSPWAQATVQMQDSRVGGYGTTAPKSVQKPVDLRLAYAELGKKQARGLTATVGRQELTMADGRLVASPDWGNVGRTYDGVRLTAVVPGFRVEVFGAAPVDVNLSFSRAKYGERMGGAWATFDRLKPLGYVDVYEVVKHNHTAVGEGGTRGDQMLYTTGVRFGGPIGKAIAWEADNVFQRGHSASDRFGGWGTHEGVSWTIGRSAWKPKLGVEYSYASGDRNPSDGVKQTFDQVYASTHGKWGLGDYVGWRNMHHAALKFEVTPNRRLKVNTALNKLRLATVSDAWYGSSGSKLVTNRKATSSDLGWEPDVFAVFTITRDLAVGGGLAVLFGGDFVRQSTDVETLWTPYVMWTMKF
jgi:hypothetical protein